MNLTKGIFRVLVNLILIITLAIATVNAKLSPSYAQTADRSQNKFESKDTERVREFSREEKNLKPVTLEAKSSTDSANMQALQSTTYNVQPILFIPSDYLEDPKNINAINDTFKDIRSWYSGALEQNNTAYTFEAGNVIVYKSNKPFSFYKCVDQTATCDNYDGVWGNIQTELLNAGFPLWTPGYSHIIMVKGAGGWSGSSCTPNCYINWPLPGPASTSGVSILGDWALDAISGTVNRDCYAALGTACYDQSQRGAIAHELGHTFGLAHAMDDQTSLMSAWWLYPYVSLVNVSGNDEKLILRTSSFFTTSACTYNSALVEMVQPTNIKTGTQFTSLFNLKNNGLCKWKANNASLSLIRDNVWGLSSKTLNSDVYPAQSISLSLNLKAPVLSKSKLPATKYSNWQMKIGRTFFGPIFGSQITIVR